MRRFRRDRELGLMLPVGAHMVSIYGASRIKSYWITNVTVKAFLCEDASDRYWGYSDGSHSYPSCGAAAAGGSISDDQPPHTGETITQIHSYENAGGDFETQIYMANADQYPLINLIVNGISAGPPDFATSTYYFWGPDPGQDFLTMSDGAVDTLEFIWS